MKLGILAMAGLVSSTMVTGAATAKVTEAEAARLGRDLTPVGATRAGNAEGTIPAWEGGLTAPPAGYDPKKKDVVDPFPNDKPKFFITGANADQYKDKLSPGQLGMLKIHPTYKLPVYETRRSCALPERVYEATKRNALTASVTDDDNGIQDALLGTPFPIPKTGVEAIWNHRLRYRGFKFRRYYAAALVGANGKYELVRGFDQGIVHYGGPGLDTVGDVAELKQLNNVYVSYMNVVTFPPRASGTVVLVHDSINAKETPRQVWVYNPGIRRVLRAANAAYDNPASGTDGMLPADAFDMYNGATDRYTFELKPGRETYIGYNAYGLVSHDRSYKELLAPKHLNQDFSRYELHRTWVVDAKLKEGQRHIYGRRTFYFDEDSWNIVLVDAYDTRGVLWRLQEAPLVNVYVVPFCAGALDVAYDLLDEKYLVFGLQNEEAPAEYPEKLTRKQFTPDAMRSQAEE